MLLLQHNLYLIQGVLLICFFFLIFLRYNYFFHQITDKDTLINKIKNKTVVFTGQSGAGKSTLLNKIDSTLELKTNEISKHLGRGKHTTRHTELFKTNNCYIVDTPGFSKIDFIDMTKEDIRDNMKEMFNNLEYCKYRDCMHYKEEGCHVIELVKRNEILPSRYITYIALISKKLTIKN